MLLGCQQAAPRVHSRSGIFFGGIPCSIQIYEENGKPLTAEYVDRLADDIFKRLQDIDNKMSYHLINSEISKINVQAGRQAVRVSDETFYLIETSLEYARMLAGRFDIAVGPLVQLWGIGTGKARLPSPGEIADKLSLVDYRQVQIDKQKKEVFLPRAGMSIDLGAVAKGYACDETAIILKKAGIKHAIVDIGGNIMVLGRKVSLQSEKIAAGSSTSWRVGIRHPVRSESESELIGVLKTDEQSVVTSGVYERFFIQGDKQYHHILDTKTGYPVENSLVSVTIIAQKSILADIFSTGVFAMGLEKGLVVIEDTPEAEAIFITKDKEIYLSSGIQAGNFEILDENYTLIKK